MNDFNISNLNLKYCIIIKRPLCNRFCININFASKKLNISLYYLLTFFVINYIFMLKYIKENNKMHFQ